MKIEELNQRKQNKIHYQREVAVLQDFKDGEMRVCHPRGGVPQLVIRIQTHLWKIDFEKLR